MNEQPGFFDLEDRYALLSDGGDPLERLNEVVLFGDFRPLLEDALDRKDRGLGGRPPMDAVMMFKVLVLQSYKRKVVEDFRNHVRLIFSGDTTHVKES